MNISHFFIHFFSFVCFILLLVETRTYFYSFVVIFYSHVELSPFSLTIFALLFPHFPRKNTSEFCSCSRYLIHSFVRLRAMRCTSTMATCERVAAENECKFNINITMSSVVVSVIVVRSLLLRPFFHLSYSSTHSPQRTRKICVRILRAVVTIHCVHHHHFSPVHRNKRQHLAKCIIQERRTRNTAT